MAYVHEITSLSANSLYVDGDFIFKQQKALNGFGTKHLVNSELVVNYTQVTLGVDSNQWNIQNILHRYMDRNGTFFF